MQRFELRTYYYKIIIEKEVSSDPLPNVLESVQQVKTSRTTLPAESRFHQAAYDECLTEVAIFPRQREDEISPQAKALIQKKSALRKGESAQRSYREVVAAADIEAAGRFFAQNIIPNSTVRIRLGGQFNRVAPTKAVLLESLGGIIGAINSTNLIYHNAIDQYDKDFTEKLLSNSLERKFIGLTLEGMVDDEVDNLLSRVGKHLRSLDLSMREVQGRTLYALRDFLLKQNEYAESQHKLERLSIRSNFWLDTLPRSRILAEFLCKKDTTLTSLDIGSCMLDNEELALIFSALMTNNTLTHLNVSLNVAEDYDEDEEEEELEELEEELEEEEIAPNQWVINLCLLLKSNATLRSLDISRNVNFGLEGAKMLAQVLALEHSRIDYLYLDRCEINDEGVTHLFDAFAKKRAEALKAINLQQNHITAEGANVIANFLEKSSLQHLNLRDNLIGNAGLLSIFNAAAVNTSLITLDLSGGIRMSEGDDLDDVINGLARVIRVSKNIKTLSLDLKGNISFEAMEGLINAIQRNESASRINIDTRDTVQEFQIRRARLVNKLVRKELGIQPMQTYTWDEDLKLELELERNPEFRETVAAIVQEKRQASKDRVEGGEASAASNQDEHQVRKEKRKDETEHEDEDSRKADSPSSSFVITKVTRRGKGGAGASTA